ncbi:MAG: T9SS type A sorting domain-containing protein [Bacteroidetes bacterium]|nr:T9SS type A sorting domain-containing protein [Bacteroidota bacterium]
MKKQFYILILLALVIKIKAQTLTLQQREEQYKIEKLERDKKILINARTTVPYIFEGTVIKSDEFYNKSMGIYVQNVVKITYIFKGEIKDSIIVLITEPYAEIPQNPDVRPDLQKNLPTGYKGIFYADLNKQNLDGNEDVTKLYLHTHRQMKIIIEQENNISLPIAQFGSIVFDNKDQLYNTIGFFPPNYVPFKYTEGRTMTKEDEVKLNKHNEQIKKKDEKNKVAATAITYSFQNMVVTGTTQKYYEFDIAAYASLSNTYLDVAQTNIGYAPAAFGNSVSAANNVTVSYLPAFPIANYPYLLKNDYAANAVQVILAADFSTPNRLILPTTLTNLFHVKMKVICNQTVNLSFTGTTGGSYASNPTTLSYTNFSPVNDNDLDNTVACALAVTSFAPNQINGGRNEVLTINGVNFGTTQGSGYVKLKNANDGGGSFIQLDADDYVSWSDTQIKIKVPSFSRGNGTITAVGDPVGNGVIMVSNGTSTTTSAAQVIVYYSRFNYNEPTAPLPFGLTYRKEKGYSTGNTAAQNYTQKYPIKIDSISCLPFPGALTCIKRAVKEWICETKIPFVIVGDTTFPNTTPTNNSPSQNVLDGVSTIRFSDFLLSTSVSTAAVGATYHRLRRCDTAITGKVIGTIPEFDIEMDLNRSWFCDTSYFATKPANKYDLYEVILHELGHANLLKHNNAFNSIMFWDSEFTLPLTGGQRRIYVNIMDYLGGQQIITESKNTTYGNGCSFLSIAPDNKCGGVIGIKENTLNQNNIKVQPNPFADNLLISLNTKNKSSVKISVYDMLGKQVKVFEEANNIIGDYKIEYKGNELNSGVYFIKIQINNDCAIEKIIKQ